MKLKSYNTTNVTTQRSNTSTFIHLQESGVIGFNKGIQEQLNLKAGDKIEFLQNEEDSAEWFLTINENGFPLKQYKGKSHTLIISVKNIVQKIIESSGATYYGRCPVAEGVDFNGNKIYPIITAALKSNESE